MVSTSIAPDVGISWGDGQLRFHDKDYAFRVDGLTFADETILTHFAGDQVSAEGPVYNLKNMADFNGTYQRVKPPFTLADDGTGLVLENAKGMIMHITKVQKDEYFEFRVLDKGLTVQLTGW
jgi:hypothetical protein